ncbi:MAG: hypothetical protein SGILL_008087 [Bacillariaceae sp.]
MSSSNRSLRWLLVVATVFLAVDAQEVSQRKVKKSFTSPLAGETFHVLEECVDTQGEYTLLQVDIPPNINKVPFHHHDSYDEYIAVIGDGPYHTTINGVNRTYHKGESFVFPVNVEHLWWTGDQATAIYIKMEPCFDGFHDSIEIYSKLPEEQLDPTTKHVKDLWTTAVIINIGGTIIHSNKWYERPLLWLLKVMANSPWGKRLEQELRQQYIDDGDNEEPERPGQEGKEL